MGINLLQRMILTLITLMGRITVYPSHQVISRKIKTDCGDFDIESGTFYLVPKNLRWLKKAWKQKQGVRVINIPPHYKQNRELVIATLQNSILEGRQDFPQEVLLAELHQVTRHVSDVIAASPAAAENARRYL